MCVCVYVYAEKEQKKEKKKNIPSNVYVNYIIAFSFISLYHYKHIPKIIFVSLESH